MATPAAPSARSSAGREVQPGGRRRGGALQPRVDRLVALGVGQRRPYVGRQRASRRSAPAGRAIGSRSAGDAAHLPAAVAQRLAHLDRERLGRGLAAQRLAAAQAAARQDLPGLAALHRAPAGARRRRRAGRSSAGAASRSRKSSSTRPPVGLRKCARAGMTRVSLRTSTSPRPQQRRQLAEAPVVEPQGGAGPPATSSREASRGSTGTWAISSAGSVVVELFEPHRRRRSRAAGAALVPLLPPAGHAAAVALPVQPEAPAFVDAARIPAPQVGVDELDAGDLGRRQAGSRDEVVVLPGADRERGREATQAARGGGVGGLAQAHLETLPGSARGGRAAGGGGGKGVAPFPAPPPTRVTPAPGRRRPGPRPAAAA